MALEEPPKSTSAGEPERDAGIDMLLREAGDAGSREDFDAMFAAVQTEVEADERRPGHRLRATRTVVRRCIAMGTATALTIFVAFTTLRPDLSVYPMARYGLELAAYAVLLVTCVLVALRPAYVPELPRPACASLIVAALAACVVIAVLPPAHAIPSELLDRMPDSRWTAGSPCLYLGLLFGLPVYFVVRWLDRETPLSGVLSATAAGLMGNLALQIHCPLTSVQHRLFAHAAVAFIFVGCFGLAYAFDRMIRRRA